MSGAVELEAELRAEIERYIARCREMSEGGKYSWWTRLAEILATLRSDNERLGRELTKCENMHLPEATSAAFIGHMNCMKAFDEMQKQKFAAEAERDTLLAQVAKMRGALEPFAAAAEHFDCHVKDGDLFPRPPADRP